MQLRKQKGWGIPLRPGRLKRKIYKI